MELKPAYKIKTMKAQLQNYIKLIVTIAFESANIVTSFIYFILNYL